MSIAQLRKQAWDAFELTGLPTTRQEEWKYTSLARLGSTLGETWWTPAVASTLSETGIDALGIPDLDAWRVVFADGRLLQTASNLPEGARLTPLSGLLADNEQQAAVA
ncbi:MAG: hypothetical protein Q9M23_04280, partial [Mariprofundaceae bacterium]|nr:hypothetical protein [Mariprofundaceae bacterium]